MERFARRIILLVLLQLGHDPGLLLLRKEARGVLKVGTESEGQESRRGGEKADDD